MPHRTRLLGAPAPPLRRSKVTHESVYAEHVTSDTTTGDAERLCRACYFRHHHWRRRAVIAARRRHGYHTNPCLKHILRFLLSWIRTDLRRRASNRGPALFGSRLGDGGSLEQIARDRREIERKRGRESEREREKR
eukprot:sb/3474581/